MTHRAPQSNRPTLGRNQPCWCGSGRKYKHCHWGSDHAGAGAPSRADADASPLSRVPLAGGAGSSALPSSLRPAATQPRSKEDLARLLQQSAAHHQAGRLHEAELGYRAVLQQDPNNLDALHLLGLIAISAGQPVEGERLINRAIALNPDFAEARSNLGNLLREQGRSEAALVQLQRAVAIKPGLANARHNLGIVLNELGRTKEAIAEHRLALSLQPDYPETLNSLGNELKQIDALDEAEACFRRALAIRPEYAEAHNGLGIVLHARLQRDAADASFRKAIALRPNFAEAHSNLGLLLLAQDRLIEAEALCRAALQMKARYPDGHNNLGIVLHSLHDYRGAEAEYRAALALRPKFVDAMSNLGGALHAQGRMDEADDACRQAIALRPDHAEAYQKYGVVCVDSGRTEEAIELYRQALRLRPDYALGHWSLSLALLARGQYEEGWAEYEWRFKCAELLLEKPRGERPEWDGSPLAGQTLLLYGEQGLGDAIQFLRYVWLAAERGGRVIVLCRSPLRALVSRIPGVSAVICEGEVVPAFDVHAALMSLPAIFRTTLQTIPALIPYLSVDDAKRQRWAQRVSAAAGGRRKVGLVWSGNPDHKNDRLRSCGFAALEPLSKLSGIAFFSLQKPPGAAQLHQARAQGSAFAAGIYDWTDELHDLEDTAALLLNLDLVISIDSAVVHLAGALGVATWALLAVAADWRWLEDRDTSPWYPTVRLFRQKRHDDWADVVHRVITNLEI